MKTRKTTTDGVKREYMNSLFTDLQAIHKRLINWELSGANNLEKMQLLMSFNQVEQQRKYTSWFIGLTIVNIVILIVSVLINIFCWPGAIWK